MQSLGMRSNRVRLMACTDRICVNTWSNGSALTFMCPGELAGPDTFVLQRGSGSAESGLCSNKAMTIITA